MTVTITELILVCCHGIWLGGPSLGMNEEEWLIAPFQRGETPTFVEHLKAGLNCLIASPNAVLIFSGYSCIALSQCDGFTDQPQRSNKA
jgi:hypothetical protein